MKTKDNLLKKYYKGETSLEEEKQLKELMLQEDILSAEKDIFDFYTEAGKVPDDLETAFMNKNKKK